MFKKELSARRQRRSLRLQNEEIDRQNRQLKLEFDRACGFYMKGIPYFQDLQKQKTHLEEVIPTHEGVVKKMKIDLEEITQKLLNETHLQNESEVKLKELQDEYKSKVQEQVYLTSNELDIYLDESIRSGLVLSNQSGFHVNLLTWYFNPKRTQEIRGMIQEKLGEDWSVDYMITTGDLETFVISKNNTTTV